MSNYEETTDAIVRPVMRAEDAERAWREYLDICTKILTDDDYVYYVRYVHAGEESLKGFSKRSEAEALIKKLSAFPNDYRLIELIPRKKRSAWDKLARFFGLTVPAFGATLANVEILQIGKFIVEKRTGESFAIVVYRDAETLTTISASATVAVRAPNGRTAIGEAACSASERPPGKKPHVHPDHDITSTAWTRALNRAISRCIGAGEVSAEEIEDRIEDSAVESNSKNSSEAASSTPSPKGPRSIAGSGGALPASAPAASLGASERAAADSPAPLQTAAAQISKSAADLSDAKTSDTIVAADNGRGDDINQNCPSQTSSAPTTKFRRLTSRGGNPPKLVERLEHMQKWLYGQRAVSLTNKREDRIIWYMILILDKPLSVKLESVPGRLDMKLWDAAIKQMPPEERIRRVSFLESVLEEAFNTPDEFREFAMKQIEEYFGKVEGGKNENKSAGTA